MDSLWRLQDCYLMWESLNVPPSSMNVPQSPPCWFNVAARQQNLNWCMMNCEGTVWTGRALRVPDAFNHLSSQVTSHPVVSPISMVFDWLINDPNEPADEHAWSSEVCRWTLSCIVSYITEWKAQKVPQRVLILVAHIFIKSMSLNLLIAVSLFFQIKFHFTGFESWLTSWHTDTWIWVIHFNKV